MKAKIFKRFISKTMVAAVLLALLTTGAFAQAEQALRKLVGTWEGSYYAGQGETGLILNVYEENGSYKAIFHFYNLPYKTNSKEGSYEMSVSYTEGKYNLIFQKWIEHPSDYGSLDLSGTINGNVFSGSTDYGETFGLVRKSSQIETAVPLANLTNAFTDPRDGKTYKSVRIGTQIWMAENLNYHGEDGHLGLCYDKKPENCQKYGRLYDWSEAMDLDREKYNNAMWEKGNVKHQGICPQGWYLPNNKEWTELMNFLISNKKDVSYIKDDGEYYSNAGKYLKAKSGWTEWECKFTERKEDDRGRVKIIEHDYCITDEYGFAALPGGSGFNVSSGALSFAHVGAGSIWWSATEANASSAYDWIMIGIDSVKNVIKRTSSTVNDTYSRVVGRISGVLRDSGDKTSLQYVRCVKDSGNVEWLGVPAEHRQDWGNLQIDRSVMGKPLTIVKKHYGKGIGTHANGMLRYNLDGKYERLTAIIGLDQNEFCGNGVQIKIFGDGNLLINTGKLGHDKEYPVDIPLSGVKQLIFEMDALGNIDCDNVNIAVPILYRKN